MMATSPSAHPAITSYRRSPSTSETIGAARNADVRLTVHFATPVFACPGHDSGDAPVTKTADKEPAKEAPKKEEPKKDAPKATEAPKTAKQVPKKDAPKAPTKVSQK